MSINGSIGAVSRSSSCNVLRGYIATHNDPAAGSYCSVDVVPLVVRKFCGLELQLAHITALLPRPREKTQELDGLDRQLLAAAIEDSKLDEAEASNVPSALVPAIRRLSLIHI